MSDIDSSDFDEFVDGSDSDEGPMVVHQLYSESSAEDTDAQTFDSDTNYSHVSAEEEEHLPDYSVEETEFDDEEDNEAFRGISRYHYRQVILPLKVGSEPHHITYAFHSRLREDGKHRFGKLVQKASRLKQFHVTFKEQQPQSLGLIFQDVRQEHALRR